MCGLLIPLELQVKGREHYRCLPFSYRSVDQPTPSHGGDGLHVPILLLGIDTTGIHKHVPFLCVYKLAVLVVLPMHSEQRESAYDVFKIFVQEMDLVFMGARWSVRMFSEPLLVWFLHHRIFTINHLADSWSSAEKENNWCVICWFPWKFISARGALAMPAFFIPLCRFLLLGKDTIGIYQQPLCVYMNCVSSITFAEWTKGASLWGVEIFDQAVDLGLMGAFQWTSSSLVLLAQGIFTINHQTNCSIKFHRKIK